MSETEKLQDAKTAEALPGMRLSWGMRFSPHAIVIVLTLLVAIPPLRGAIVSGVYWWWDKSYTKAEYVMEEARPNDGSPYIAGHIAGSTDQHNLLGLMQGPTMVVKAAPQEAFATGKHIAIWHSADAPNFVVFGDEVNDVPVAAVAERPGLPAFLGYLAWLLATLIVGFGLMMWVAKHWTRTYGNLPIRRHAGHTFRY